MNVRIVSFTGLLDVLSYLGIKTLVGNCLAATQTCYFAWHGLTIEFPLLIMGTLMVITPLGLGLGKLLFSTKKGRALIRLVK